LVSCVSLSPQTRLSQVEISENSINQIQESLQKKKL